MAEKKWTKNKLSVSLASRKELMFTYQCTIREARNNYFSELIAKQSHNPRILFKTVNSVVGPPPSQPVESSPDKCQEFLNHFINKIVEIWQNFNTDFREMVVDSCPLSTLTHFSKISLSTIKRTIALSKSSTCLLDSIATWFSALYLLVYPLLKKPSLDPLPYYHYCYFRSISKLPFYPRF